MSDRANQLAHHLQSLGVKPETLVSICVKRSLEMIVGLLGILKAGGAYVPLDPAYPQERLADILEDTQQSILLTQERFQDKLPDYAGKTICLDIDWPVIAQYSTAKPIDLSENGKCIRQRDFSDYNGMCDACGGLRLR
ncbi:AMP-binding protein [Nostoc sp. LEGE 12450]|uniref:AMP-binding protein n=1 Tax=Nostoc sp. LEGE 12450 TaxID=1828643 RepID=UPI003A0FE868